jgi:hypothetical protein
MSAYDWNLSAGSPLCELSDAFYRTAREAIFQQVTTDTTPEQFQAALDSLLRLREELEQDIRPMHYGALIGRHRCIHHLYREANARLRSLQIMQPQSKPPEPDAPTQAPLTREEVLGFFENTPPPDTFFGEDRDE